MLAISSRVLLTEVQTAKAILTKWEESIQTGVPAVDLPAPPDRLEDWLREFCGEVRVVAGKMDVLAEILQEQLPQ